MAMMTCCGFLSKALSNSVPVPAKVSKTSQQQQQQQQQHSTHQKWTRSGGTTAGRKQVPIHWQNSSRSRRLKETASRMRTKWCALAHLLW